ncbi:MAG: tRNA (adenosine(37)-N6)-threonylcarbamoyltransferase complex ATPase subunit type 1 TsaE [Patescibacteria group bacterium]|mgnify:CR=1 FL=1
MDREVVTKSAQATQKVGRDFGNNLKGGEVVGLVGDLGGGKTTFVQGLAQRIGVKERIISPTFIIVREYENKFGGNLYHVDLYRLENNLKQELINLGINNFSKDPKNVIVVEWADKARKYLPISTTWVEFVNEGENKRNITIRN